MQHFETNGDTNMAVFFYGAIFNIIANVEGTTYSEYAMRSVIGGIVWIVFKLLGDLIAHKFNFQKKEKDEDQ